VASIPTTSRNEKAASLTPNMGEADQLVADILQQYAAK
jgi:hypothetical protein